MLFSNQRSDMKKEIFKTVYQLATPTEIPSQITKQTFEKGKFTVSTKSVKTLAEYHEWVFQNTIEVTEHSHHGSKTSGVDRSVVDESPAYPSLRRFFLKGTGMAVVVDACLATHKYQIDEKNPPKFSKEFIESLNELSVTSSRATAYKRFVAAYGTHFPTSTVMGAKAHFIVLFDRSEMLQLSDSESIDCAKNLVQKELPSGSMSSLCRQQLHDTLPSGESRVLSTFVGPRPESSVNLWLTTVKRQPFPIRRTLKPMSELLNHHAMNVMRDDAERYHVHFDVRVEQTTAVLVTMYQQYEQVFQVFVAFP